MARTQRAKLLVAEQDDLERKTKSYVSLNAYLKTRQLSGLSRKIRFDEEFHQMSDSLLTELRRKVSTRATCLSCSSFRLLQ